MQRSAHITLIIALLVISASACSDGNGNADDGTVDGTDPL